jgi:geranylgeranyl diphosphate synthase type II
MVDARLDGLLPSAEDEPRPLHEAMRYSALAPGKRIRPAFAAAAHRALKPGGTGWLDAACAVEMVHCFSLIHDDLPAIDNDDLRRGRPTCHIQFGEAVAILAGDALFAKAFETVGSMEAEPSVRADCCLILARASGSPGLVAGEVLDILGEGLPPSADLVQRIHEWKTGALIAAACEIGAATAGASPEERRALAAFGLACGLAFQAADDVLNETSTPEELGKAVGSDRELGKQTYPAVFGLEAAVARADELIESAILGLQRAGIESEELAALAKACLHRRA